MTAVNTAPIDWRGVEDTITAWLEDSTQINWVLADQSAPQPEYPYGTLTINPGTTTRQVRSNEQWKEDGSLKLRRQEDFTASLQINIGPPDDADPDCNARMLADMAAAHLDTPTQAAVLEAAGLAVRGVGQPQHLNLEIGSQFIARTLLEVRFGLASVLEDIPATTPGYFNKVEVSSTIEGTQVPGSHDLNDEIWDPNA